MENSPAECIKKERPRFWGANYLWQNFVVNFKPGKTCKSMKRCQKGGLMNNFDQAVLVQWPWNTVVTFS